MFVTEFTRRQAIQTLAFAGAGSILRVSADAQGQDVTIAGQPVELRVASISAQTIRISIVPRGAPVTDLNKDGGLVQFDEERRSARAGGAVKAGDLTVAVTNAPLGVRVLDAAGRVVQ